MNSTFSSLTFGTDFSTSTYVRFNFLFASKSSGVALQASYTMVTRIHCILYTYITTQMRKLNALIAELPASFPTAAVVPTLGKVLYLTTTQISNYASTDNDRTVFNKFGPYQKT